MLPHEIFLSLIILSAIFNVSVLGCSVYFCLKNNKDLLLLSLLSQSLLVFFLCISRAQTMNLEHQSLTSIILYTLSILYTKYLSEDSRRSQHADLLNLCHSSSL